jgi:hypothetical protein
MFKPQNLLKNKNSNNLKIKFNLTPIQETINENIYSLLSNTPFHVFLPEYGLTHSSIQIGSKVLHWFDCSLVFFIFNYF